MISDFIYHYTNIDTLKLIMRNRTIRFNRLDGVDDLTESTSFKNVKLANFLFASCWTIQQSESIPQWDRYTDNMAGVRISFPPNPFWYRKIIAPKGKGIVQHGSFNSPIPLDKMFTDDYVILPMFLNVKHFRRKVIYTPEFIDKKNNAIIMELDSQGKILAKINDPTGIASYKSPYWEFQKELRFVLLIFPSFPLPPLGPFSIEFSDNIPNIVANSLYSGKGPRIRFIDLDIDPNIFNNIHITTGPLCTSTQKKEVQLLLNECTTNGTLSNSELEGTIRNK